MTEEMEGQLLEALGWKPSGSSQLVVVMGLEDLKYCVCNFASTKPLVRRL